MGIKIKVKWLVFCLAMFMLCITDFVYAVFPESALAGEDKQLSIQNAPPLKENIVSAPVAEEPAPKKEEKITLDLKGVDIIELFKMLSQKSGLTIISTPQVSGRITVFLNNLSFEDALDVIITVQDLAVEKKENLIKIMTAGEYEKIFGKKFSERKKVKTIRLTYAKPSNIANIISALKSDSGKIITDEPSGTILLIETPQIIALIEETVKELDQPLETAVFDINYARSADVKTYVNALVTPGLGQVVIDERNNKVIVSDLTVRLAKIKELIQAIDESSRQVMLTVEIVQVDLNNSFKRGIDWEKLYVSNKLDNLDFVGKFPLNPDPGKTEPQSSHQRISVGTLSRDDYSTVISLLQEYGEVETISQPRIMAVNNEEAKILIGVRDAFVTATLSQGQTNVVTSESVQFVDVGVKLKVVPTINKEGFITMRIKPEVSSIRNTITTNAGTRIPILQTSEAETVVKVKDGTMIILAGFMRDERTDSVTGVPVLSRIPFLGGLFGTRTKTAPKSELIVFITPKLVSGEVKLKREVKRENE